MALLRRPLLFACLVTLAFGCDATDPGGDLDASHGGGTDASVEVDGGLFDDASDAGGVPLDHARYFPIGPDTIHESQGCTDCHTDATDRTVVSCAGCHAPADLTPQHAGVGGFSTEGARCVRCHADSQVNPVAAHLPFEMAARSMHFRTDCLACHPATREDKVFAAEFSSFACITCHRRDHNVNRGDAACVQCHPTGSVR